MCARETRSQSSAVSCGQCDYCVTGHEQLCESPQWAGLSIHDGGCYAEYLSVPHERYLIKLSKLRTTDAAPLTDAALTPYRAIKKAPPLLEPDTTRWSSGWAGWANTDSSLKLPRGLSDHCRGCPRAPQLAPGASAPSAFSMEGMMVSRQRFAMHERTRRERQL